MLSNSVFESINIFNSFDVCESSELLRCKNVSTSYFCSDCSNIKNSFFCFNLNEDLENNLIWFFSYLSNSNSKKVAGSPKHANKWIKFGGKSPVILPFMK